MATIRQGAKKDTDNEVLELRGTSPIVFCLDRRLARNEAFLGRDPRKPHGLRRRNERERSRRETGLEPSTGIERVFYRFEEPPLLILKHARIYYNTNLLVPKGLGQNPLSTGRALAVRSTAAADTADRGSMATKLHFFLSSRAHLPRNLLAARLGSAVRAILQSAISSRHAGISPS